MSSCDPTPDVFVLAPSGGSWTAPVSARSSMITPASVLNSRQKLDFWTGMGFFRDPWITAPASTTARDGLGPLFNADSCISCHGGGGRGKSVLSVPNSPSTILRVGVRDSEGQINPHPIFGDQLQSRATYGKTAASARVRGLGYFPGEAQIRTAVQHRTVVFDNNDEIQLTYPVFSVGGADESLLISSRIAPPLFGLGLLEAIVEDDLAKLEDASDANDDGISGRLRRFDDGSIGRFGWKASHPSVASQTAAAFQQDIGISNPLLSLQNCSPKQSQCQRQSHGNDAKEGVEIPKLLFDKVVFFTAHIAPPSSGKTPLLQQGQRLFTSAQCASCHQPSHTVAIVNEAGVNNDETIWPYTDLLLHDMGPALADTLPENGVAASEWRTPPLWGLGKNLDFNRHVGLLHDGRARTIDEAIVWHGGEASASRDFYLTLSAEERAAMTAFIRAL
ncbi:MAG: di-heme oxidoredictase family protein [Pseudomonadota bacterium]